MRDPSLVDRRYHGISLLPLMDRQLVLSPLLLVDPISNSIEH